MNFKNLLGQAAINYQGVLRHLSQIEKLPNTEIIRCCVNCDYFDKQKEICKIADQRPPAIVIVNACGQYQNVDDDIPF